MKKVAPYCATGRIGIAFVGLRFGRHVIDQIMHGPGADHFRLAAVCDLDPERLRRAAEELNVRAFDQLDDVLTDDSIPAVCLITPPQGRADLVRRCLAAGKDVLTTKPFDLDANAAARVLAEARRLGRVVHLNSPSPDPPDLAQIRQWIREYDLGQPVAAHAEMLTSVREEADGSWYDDPSRCPLAPMLRLGIYAINDLVRLFGPASQVFAQGERRRTGRPTPDQAQLALRFHAGGLATVLATYCCDNGDRYLNQLLLHCERGTIHRNLDPAMEWQPMAPYRAKLSLVIGDDRGRRLVATRDIDRLSGEYQWAEFAQAIRERRPLDEATCAAIVDGLRVVQAMGESERTGQAVTLPEGRPE